MNNKINNVFYLTLLVVIFLMALSGIQLYKADILADTRPHQKKTANEMPVPLPVVDKKPLLTDTCTNGVKNIEDYGAESHAGMEPFYKAVVQSKRTSRNVRIAFFGDSFIEGDLLTGELRKLLQKKFGGSGVGWVDITSQTASFRPTLDHIFGGWVCHSPVDTTGFRRSLQGIAERYFRPQSGSYMQYRLQDKMTRVKDTCDVASLYFKSSMPVTLATSVNGGTKQEEVLSGSESLQQKKFYQRIHKIRWEVDDASGSDDTYFYGAAFEGAKGIVLDNFSLRGSSGNSLTGIPLKHLQQMNALRPYDLIILEFGLNVATERGTDYKKYENAMKRTIAYLRTAFPHAGFLLLGVADRAHRNESGDLETMPGVKNLIRYQQYVASESGIAFWNFFEAMGGSGSMVKLVKAHKANLDYTHIKYSGGLILANILYQAIAQGEEQYERRMNEK